MLVGLVNKTNLENKVDLKETLIHKQIQKSEPKFNHLEEASKIMTQMNSPNNSNRNSFSNNNIPDMQRKRTASFINDKDKKLNRFLNVNRSDNQYSHIIDMGNQVLYIGIIGNPFL